MKVSWLQYSYVPYQIATFHEFTQHKQLPLLHLVKPRMFPLSFIKTEYWFPLFTLTLSLFHYTLFFPYNVYVHSEILWNINWYSNLVSFFAISSLSHSVFVSSRHSRQEITNMQQFSKKNGEKKKYSHHFYWDTFHSHSFPLAYELGRGKFLSLSQSWLLTWIYAKMWTKKIYIKRKEEENMRINHFHAKSNMYSCLNYE